MTSRERVSLALAHKEPDRVPIDYWGSAEITGRLLKHLGLSTLEQLLNHFDVDFRYIEGPRYIGPEPGVHADGSVDIHRSRKLPGLIHGLGRAGMANRACAKTRRLTTYSLRGKIHPQ